MVVKDRKTHYEVRTTDFNGEDEIWDVSKKNNKIADIKPAHEISHGIWIDDSTNKIYAKLGKYMYEQV